METQHTYTAHIEHHGEWWIGWILEVSGVTCQERTREELLETLKITLLEILAYDAEQAHHGATYPHDEKNAPPAPVARGPVPRMHRSRRTH